MDGELVYEDWTACEVYGHRYPDDPEDGRACLDCGYLSEDESEESE